MDITGVLVGLGNPGPKYEGTRHNTGFFFADLLLDFARREGEVQTMNGSRFECDLWKISVDALGGTWLVAKPLTFMNLSGQCVQPLLAWHRITPDALIVAHDELDIPAGALRFKCGGGNAGHNGLKSITERLGTPEFKRLRLGIGRPEFKGDVINWVLAKPSQADRDLIREAAEAGLSVLKADAKRGLKAAEQQARDEMRRLQAKRAKAAKAEQEAAASAKAD